MTTTTKFNHSACVLTTSFDLIHTAIACVGRYQHLAKALGGITEYGKLTPIPLTLVLEANGLQDAIWALQAVPPEQEAMADRLAQLFICEGADRLISLYEREHPGERRPRQAIDAVRAFARGQITLAELEVARAAARNHMSDGPSALPWSAAWNAVWDAAWIASWIASRAAPRVAARGLARSLVLAAGEFAAAFAPGDDAVKIAARNAEEAFQQESLIWYLMIM